jgi:hypothetical protein
MKRGELAKKDKASGLKKRGVYGEKYEVQKKN